MESLDFRKMARTAGVGLVFIGLVLMVLALFVPGPLVGRPGVIAPPLALPGFIMGIVLVILGLLYLLRWR